MDFNEVLSSIIMNTLDDIDYGEVAEIIKLLKSVGVKKLCHIGYVQESDLSEHLNKIIQARMLIESFKSFAVVNDNRLPAYQVMAEAPPQLVPPVLVSTKTVESDSDMVDISWHLMPRNVRENLEKGQNLKSTEFRAMVRVIVDDILKMNANPPKKLVAKVAEQCVRKFPALKDKFDTFTLGTGYDNLSYRLYTRLENLRRKPSILHHNYVDSPPVKKRNVQIDSYGCVEWSTNLPEGVTIDALISKKEILHKLCLATEMDEAIKLLEETYYLQRSSINSNCKISELLKDWPILFTERAIEAHFKILMDIELYKILENTVTSKGRKLLSFFRSSSQKEVKAFMVETDIQIDNPNEILLVVLGLGKFFEESTTTVFLTDEVLNPHNLEFLPKHPCLVGKGTSILRCEEFMLTIDGVAVNTFKDPAVAVASWFATYYILNLVYPIEFSCTLEFFQRCFVGINPVCGSKTERRKGKKLYHGVHLKILNLLNKLDQFDSWINDCRNK